MQERPQFPQARRSSPRACPTATRACTSATSRGVFVPADVFARFLRDRIGAENVLLRQRHRLLRLAHQRGLPQARRGRRVRRHHRRLRAGATTTRQKAALGRLRHQPRHLRGVRASGHAGDDARSEITDEFIEAPVRGRLARRSAPRCSSTTPRRGTFLNGRQVHGPLPRAGLQVREGLRRRVRPGPPVRARGPHRARSPRSRAQSPEMRPVSNWYFDLPALPRAHRASTSTASEARPDASRPSCRTVVEEFLAPPVIYIKNELREDVYRRSTADAARAHRAAQPRRASRSFDVEFADIDARDARASACWPRRACRFRTGKALVPFRITGNIEWGVKAPEHRRALSGAHRVVLARESLWAPIAFSRPRSTRLAAADVERAGATGGARDDAQVYQFIGQDNIYFYGVAQPALMALTQRRQVATPRAWRRAAPDDARRQPPHPVHGQEGLVARARSSRPSADELLDHYTVEQLRAHWLALGPRP